jgi:non-specific serine/threonine protein kinase/serine/threonine-protein kinase
MMPSDATPAAHRLVTELFLRALEVAPTERAAWLGDLDRAHPVHAAAVRQLVDAHLQADGFLVVTDGGRVGEGPASRAGEVVGAFVIEREIGHGGMGTVYLATREGAGFSQQVALKLLAPHEGAAAAARLRDERRILAGLNHPNIAHFVDGGTTDGGLPFIAMEYVDGQPIVHHCSQARLDVPARLRLFLRVCGAVHFAHQHLVVHRDIKPSNILVTGDGTPKLLDFGIARLLDAGDPGSAARTLRELTPHYASPEQVRGEPVTTATDIYSLGVLLFELVTGRGPYRHVTPESDPLTVMEAIRDAIPERPGAVAMTGLRFGRDLDAIVLRTLRKDPRERYASAEHLAQDIARYLDGLPVDARRGTTTYRLQRFVARHRFGVAAAAALALALVAGGAATAWQARVAQAERDKAQNRFRQIQEFSRSLLFDVHATLRDVPGATSARRMLLDRAVAFLDGLAADADDDRALLRVLAQGYEQLAAVQGLGLTQNVGDTAAALASLDKASGYVDRLRVEAPAEVSLLTLATSIHFARAVALNELRRPDAATEAAVHAALVDALERVAPPGSAMVDVARGHTDIGRMRADAGDLEAAEREYRRAVEVLASQPEPLQTAQAISVLATARKRLGAVLLRRKAYAESEQQYRQALALDEALIRLDDRPQTRFDITFTMSDLALVWGLTNRLTDAEALFRRALTIREAAAAADPKDVRALNGVAVLHGRLGSVAFARRDWPSAVVAYRAEIERREAIVGLTGRLPGRVADLSWARLRLAEALANGAEASPRAAGASADLSLARRLVGATTRSDGRVAVPAGSEPGYLALYDAMRQRLAVP